MSKPLTAYRVHLSNGTSYVTSMAADVTLGDASRYFVGSVLTDENPETGEESSLYPVRVESMKSEVSFA